MGPGDDEDVAARLVELGPEPALPALHLLDLVEEEVAVRDVGLKGAEPLHQLLERGVRQRIRQPRVLEVQEGAVRVSRCP